MDENRLVEIEQMALKATPGPWKARLYQPYPHEYRWFILSEDGMPEGHNFEVAVTERYADQNETQNADADFIATSRNLIPELVDEVRRLQKELDYANDRIEGLENEVER